MQIQQSGDFYILLNALIAGAEQRGLNRKQLAVMLKPVVFPDDERYDTAGAAKMCQRSPSTLERWRTVGKGPRYFKDQSGCIFYTGKTLREFAEVPEPIDP